MSTAVWYNYSVEPELSRATLLHAVASQIAQVQGTSPRLIHNSSRLVVLRHGTTVWFCAELQCAEPSLEYARPRDRYQRIHISTSERITPRERVQAILRPHNRARGVLISRVVRETPRDSPPNPGRRTSCHHLHTTATSVHTSHVFR